MFAENSYVNASEERKTRLVVRSKVKVVKSEKKVGDNWLEALTKYTRV